MNVDLKILNDLIRICELLEQEKIKWTLIELYLKTLAEQEIPELVQN